MISFEQLGLNGWDALKMAVVGIAVFLITYIIYPPLIKVLKAKKWVGYDIHKNARPETAESGGIGLTIGIILGVIPIGLLYPVLWNEVIVFELTIIMAAAVGLIDDIKDLSSFKKIALTIIAGLPLFILNLVGFITVDSPTLPIVGHVRLTIIYPLVLPFIIAILTNAINMCEGYNGEGSGMSAIAVFFLIICAFIAGSSEGVLFAVPILAAILAFFMFNRFPARSFPGDIGTLVMGAAIGLLGVLGSLEVAMFLAILAQVFNSFYVLTSLRGFRESHEIKVKDIWMDENDLIHASDEDKAAVTLPRLMVIASPLSEPELVKQFWALSIISGAIAVFGEIVRQWSIPNTHIDAISSILLIIACVGIYLFIVYKFRRVLGVTLIMMVVLLSGAIGLFLINAFFVDITLNWLASFVVAAVILGGWYYFSIFYFWKSIDKMKKQPGYISTAEHKRQLEAKQGKKE